MHAKNQYVALVACIMLVIPSAAFADTSSSNAQKVNLMNLQSSLATETCSISLTTGYLQSLISLNQTTFAPLNSDLTKLNGDLTTLQGYVSNNDKTSYQSFVQGQLKSDIRSANLDANNLIKANHLTKNQVATLKSERSQLQTTYNSCVFAARKQVANIKVQSYQNAITHVQNKSNTLSAKGIDTTGLNTVIANADAQLLALQNSINTANNTKGLNSALKNNCLFNSCKTGSNFHFAALSAIAAQQVVLNKLQTTLNATQYHSQITQAQNDLTAAQTTLSVVGTGQYSGTQQKDIWNNIKAASGIIHQLVQALHHK